MIAQITQMHQQHQDIKKIMLRVLSALSINVKEQDTSYLKEELTISTHVVSKSWRKKYLVLQRYLMSCYLWNQDLNQVSLL